MTQASVESTLPHRLALGLLCAVQLLLIVDVAIINVALPEIRADLALSSAGTSWVVNAYTVPFGGLLILGGRLADQVGRRRLLLAGLGVFTVGSLAAATAAGATALIVGRAFQGTGAALAAPAALAQITVLFPDGPQRHRALAVWGSVAGIGTTTAVVIGGLPHRTGRLAAGVLGERPRQLGRPCAGPSCPAR